MSWHLTGIISRKRLGSQPRKLLMLSMGDKANDDGTGVYASFQTLADMCESSRATVKRLIKQFEEEGLIRHVRMRGASNGAQTNEYDIDVAALKALPEIDEKTKTRVTENRGHGDPGSTKSKTRVTVTPKPIHEPIQLDSLSKPEPEKKLKSATAYSERFVEAWKLWPRNVRQSSKKLSAAKWAEAIREGADETAMVEAIKLFLASPQALKRDEDNRPFGYVAAMERWLVKHLETWLEAVADPSILAQPDAVRREPNVTRLNHPPSFNGHRNGNGHQPRSASTLVLQAGYSRKMGPG